MDPGTGFTLSDTMTGPPDVPVGGLGDAGGALAGYATQLQVLGAIKTAVGLFQLRPSPNTTVDGKPVVVQISFIALLKSILKNAVKLAQAAINIRQTLKTLKSDIKNFVANIKTLIDHRSEPGTAGKPITSFDALTLSSTVTNISAYNFLAIPLEVARGRCTYYANSSTTTLLSPNAIDHWDRPDIDDLKAYWTTTVQTSLIGSTGSNQNYYYDINYALAYTNAVCDAGPKMGFMSLHDVVEATSTARGEEPTTFKRTDGVVVTATVETLVGILHYDNYVTSATTCVYNLTHAADLTTTTLTQLITLKTTTDSAILDMMNRILEDQYNQANFLAKNGNISSILEAATKFVNVQQLSPGAATELYKKTIHPDILEAVIGVSHLINLGSADPDVVVAAAEAISTSTFITTSTVG